MKKIVITGSVGFIGSALVKSLRDKYEIIGIDRVKYNTEDENIAYHDFYHQDINKPLPNFKDIYAVIHLAARPGVRDSRKMFKEVCEDNILGTQRIIEKCITSWRPELLLIASSSSVYGDEGKDGRALNEDDEIVSARSPYAMSKIANEEMLKMYRNCGLLDNISSASLRFFTVYGNAQREELAIRAFTDWILRDKPITLYGTGNQVRDFTHIDDICEGIERLLPTFEEGGPRFMKAETINIGSGEAISINDIIYKICKITGKNVKIDYQPRNMFDVDRTLADIHKIHKLCGWSPRIKFDKGLEKQIEWQKKMLEKEKKGGK